jgi:hypothetical protein
VSEPRLAAGLWVSALLRRVHAAGDFATVLHRGDDVAGSVILVHRDRAGTQSARSRVVGPDGTSWRVGARGDSVDAWVARQRGYDPDLWVIELDTPDLARFVDETID